MKTAALVALWIAILSESAWLTIKAVHEHGHLNSLVYPLVVTLAFAALALTHGRNPWINALLRIFIGIAFLGAIGDRLGLLGGPGTPGVSWGSFKTFTTYTAQVNSFLPQAVIPPLAVIESFIEAFLGLTMVVGAVLPVTVRASSALLFILGTAMTISLGLGSQFPFAVFVLATGAWLLALANPSLVSVDGLLATFSAKSSKRQ